MLCVEEGVRVDPAQVSVDRDVAFVAFYERELSVQVRRAFLLVGSQDAANDIVHDAMIEVFRQWSEVRAPGAFVNRVVVNRCRDHARRTRTHRRLIAKLAARPEPAAASSDDRLDDLVTQLPFNQRAVIVLRFYGGLNTAEIAEAVGCSANSVGPWITRALRTLRGHLQ